METPEWVSKFGHDGGFSTSGLPTYDYWVAIMKIEFWNTSTVFIFLYEKVLHTQFTAPGLFWFVLYFFQELLSSAEQFASLLGKLQMLHTLEM